MFDTHNNQLSSFQDFAVRLEHCV